MSYGMEDTELAPPRCSMLMDYLLLSLNCAQRKWIGSTNTCEESDSKRFFQLIGLVGPANLFSHVKRAEEESREVSVTEVVKNIYF